MKNRVTALVGSFVFFWIAPATVAGWVPWFIMRWQVGLPLFDGDASRWLGLSMVAYFGGGR